MDLSAIKAAAKTIDILHPATEQPTGLRVTLVPLSDPKVQAVQRSITNARLAKRNTKLTSEQIDADAMQLMTAAVTGLEWTGDSSFNGDKLKCTPDNVRLLLEQDWIKKQIDDDLGRAEGFFSA